MSQEQLSQLEERLSELQRRFNADAEANVVIDSIVEDMSNDLEDTARKLFGEHEESKAILKAIVRRFENRDNRLEQRISSLERRIASLEEQP